MKTELRRTTVADVDAYRVTRLRALADAPDAFGSTLALAEQIDEAEWRRRAGGPHPTLLVLDDGQAVAMGGVLLRDDDPTAWVWGMWTAPEARGRGHGTRVLDALVDLARQSGAHDDVRLHVTEGNTVARDLYTGRGFAPTGTWEALREGSALRIEELRLALV